MRWIYSNAPGAEEHEPAPLVYGFVDPTAQSLYACLESLKEGEAAGMIPALRLPKRGVVPPVDSGSEPTRYYHWPLVGWFYRKRLRMVLAHLPNRALGRVLEVAYGSGLFLPSLAPCCRTLHGVDRHAHGGQVRRCLSRLDLQPHLMSADALALPYQDGVFDAVVNVSMLEHLTEPGRALAEMVRVLAPGGALVLGFPCRNPWMDLFFRLLGYNPREIHPSSHQDIIEAILEIGLPARLEFFPAQVPPDWALYCVCSLQNPAGGVLADA